jgi:SAM-dependent methyltransferase
VTDPDRTLWELYVLHKDTDDDHGHNHDSAPSAGEAGGAGAEAVKEEDGWEHHLVQPVPERIPRDDNSLDRVLLKGTANLRPELARLPSILREAFRALRPGGEIVLHGLGSDQPVEQPLPPLPGPASSVQYVPTEKEQMQAMLDAGFVEVRFEKLSPKPYFWVGEAELREVLLAGRKPGFRPREAAHQAVYLGPLAEVRDDFGNLFRRGARVALNIHDWQALSRGAAAGQFLLLPPSQRRPPASCCS